MKSYVIFALIAVASSAPQSNPQDVQIVRNDVNNARPDSFSFAWETSDGSRHEQQGEVKNKGTENESISVRGEYAWVSPDGDTHTVEYNADENGYQPFSGQRPGASIDPKIIAALIGKS